MTIGIPAAVLVLGLLLVWLAPKVATPAPWVAEVGRACLWTGLLVLLLVLAGDELVIGKR